MLKLRPQALRAQVPLEATTAYGPACAHFAFASDYAENALCRKNSNLTLLPLDEPHFVELFGARRGDGDPGVCKFPSLDTFVDAYIWRYEHVLYLSPENFLDHMRRCDMSPRGPKRWAAIATLWRNEFAF